MGKSLLATIALVGLCAAGELAPSGPSASGRAQPTSDAAAAARPHDHRLVRPREIEWRDGPPSLPPGCKFAVLEGDPAKEGFFAMRAKMPDGYRIPPHWHPG